MDTGRLGLQPDRLAKIGDSALVVTLADEHRAAAQDASGVIGIEADRRRIVGDGAIGVSLEVVSGCPRVVRTDNLRIELYPVTVVGNGVGVVALVLISVPPIVVGGGAVLCGFAFALDNLGAAADHADKDGRAGGQRPVDRRV